MLLLRRFAMSEKLRVRLSVERLEDRDAPAAVYVPFPGGFSRTLTFRRPPWAIVTGRAPNVAWNIVGRHGVVVVGGRVIRW
jgi:hypothetical protein